MGVASKRPRWRHPGLAVGYKKVETLELVAGGRGDLECLTDLQFLRVVDVVGGHQVFGLDVELLGDAGRTVAGFDDVRLLANRRAWLGRWRRQHRDWRGRRWVGQGCDA